MKLLVDFCLDSGNTILHLLPLNEMGEEFNPYEPFSSFALEPMYASLDAFSGYPGVLKRMESLRNLFPSGRTHIDFGFKEKKFNFLWDIYVYERESGRLDITRILEFAEENDAWLKDFALFKVIGDYQGKKPWYEWEERYKRRDPAALAEFSREHETEIIFDYWVQMHLFNQLKAAVGYADGKGVLIKGDFPLLVPRNSADVWAHQAQFRLEFEAGTAPDGNFPTGIRRHAAPCNWQKMAEDGYAYLRQRLAYWRQFYRLLRIVHDEQREGAWVVPWSEPAECGMYHGFYLPESRTRQLRQAQQLLSVIEDNAEVRFSADTPRFQTGSPVKYFGAPSVCRGYPVAMLSTQDMPEWNAWWDDEAGTVDEYVFGRACAEAGLDAKETRALLFRGPKAGAGRLRWRDSVSPGRLAQLLGKPRTQVQALSALCKDSLAERKNTWKWLRLAGKMKEKTSNGMIRRAMQLTLDSPAPVAITLLADWLACAGITGRNPEKFRMHTPNTRSDKNWSAVVPVSLEEMLKKPVTSRLRRMVAASGRLPPSIWKKRGG